MQLLALLWYGGERAARAKSWLLLAEHTWKQINSSDAAALAAIQRGACAYLAMRWELNQSVAAAHHSLRTRYMLKLVISAHQLGAKLSISTPASNHARTDINLVKLVSNSWLKSAVVNFNRKVYHDFGCN